VMAAQDGLERLLTCRRTPQAPRQEDGVGPRPGSAISSPSWLPWCPISSVRSTDQRNSDIDTA
jgi:hypothetical protein